MVSEAFSCVQKFGLMPLQASADKDKFILSPVIKEVKYRSQACAFDTEK